MRSDQYLAMFELEDRLWWYEGMRQITASILENELKASAGLRALDVGCGTGYSLRWLKERFQVESAFGLDASPHAAKLWRESGVECAAVGSAVCLPFGAGQFDLVTCFDVVYQLTGEDVGRALSEMHRVLKPGGLLFIREPAYQWLRGSHDEAVGTRHRFTLSELSRLVSSRGFALKRATYANTLLFGAAVPHRLLSRALGSTTSDVKAVPGWLNRAFRAVLRIESRLLKVMSFPFGLSVILLAGRRPES